MVNADPFLLIVSKTLCLWQPKMSCYLFASPGFLTVVIYKESPEKFYSGAFESGEG